jgi:hypothetical protein
MELNREFQGMKGSGRGRRGPFVFLLRLGVSALGAVGYKYLLHFRFRLSTHLPTNYFSTSLYLPNTYQPPYPYQSITLGYPYLVQSQPPTDTMGKVSRPLIPDAFSTDCQSHDTQKESKKDRKARLKEEARIAEGGKPKNGKKDQQDKKSDEQPIVAEGTN